MDYDIIKQDSFSRKGIFLCLVLIGIIVTTEIKIESERCNSIKNSGSSYLVMEKNADNNNDHPLLPKK